MVTVMVVGSLGHDTLSLMTSSPFRHPAQFRVAPGPAGLGLVVGFLWSYGQECMYGSPLPHELASAEHATTNRLSDSWKSYANDPSRVRADALTGTTIPLGELSWCALLPRMGTPGTRMKGGARAILATARPQRAKVSASATPPATPPPQGSGRPRAPSPRRPKTDRVVRTLDDLARDRARSSAPNPECCAPCSSP